MFLQQGKPTSKCQRLKSWMLPRRLQLPLPAGFPLWRSGAILCPRNYSPRPIKMLEIKTTQDFFWSFNCRTCKSPPPDQHGSSFSNSATASEVNAFGISEAMAVPIHRIKSVAGSCGQASFDRANTKDSPSSPLPLHTSRTFRSHPNLKVAVQWHRRCDTISIALHFSGQTFEPTNNWTLTCEIYESYRWRHRLSWCHIVVLQSKKYEECKYHRLQTHVFPTLLLLRRASSITFHQFWKEKNCLTKPIATTFLSHVVCEDTTKWDRTHANLNLRQCDDVTKRGRDKSN